MELAKINIYNPLTRRHCEQFANLIMEPAIQSIYLDLKSDGLDCYDPVYKDYEKYQIYLEALNKVECTLRMFAHNDTIIYKIFKNGEVMVLGEIFTDKDELERFNQDVIPELSKAYEAIKKLPAETIICTNAFDKQEKDVKDGIITFCRLFGFAAIRLLKEIMEDRKII